MSKRDPIKRLVVAACIGAAAMLLVACSAEDNADGSTGDENSLRLPPTTTILDPTKEPRKGSDGSMATNSRNTPAASPEASPEASPAMATPRSS